MPDAALPLPCWVDPAAVHAAFVEAEHTFWLDAGPDARAGRSWIGCGTPASADEVRAVRIGPGETTRPMGPFPGGWVGWMGYEAGAARAGAPVASSDEPSEQWMRVRTLVAFDHARRTVHVSGEDAERWVARLLTVGPAAAPVPAPDQGEARPRVTAARYAADIRACIEAIGRGDAYLLCLTTRFDIDGWIDPVAAYARLRAAAPSHHGLLLRSGGIALVGASPERFLHTEAGRILTHPIKGTRPRDADPDRDAALAAELAADAKERAENVMIVDLMRNDLARVCDPATVSVDRLWEIESYPAVHQLVSTVGGRPHPGISLGEVWDAVFPAGSMTGAPKLSAMTLLHGIEQRPRGAFAGCAGWVGQDGAFDLAMTIRTLVTGTAGAYVGAGGGITWSSDVAAEVAEVALKATGPLRAAGARLPADWLGRGPVS